MTIPNETAVEQLNSFLRGEISSVETYRQALTRVTDATARAQLEDCQRSHQQRVEALRERIVTLGGQPAQGSGLWGAFAKLIESGATVFGEEAAIKALESGEDHGLADYRRELDKLDVETRSFVTDRLLPAQQKTHDTLSLLKRTLH